MARQTREAERQTAHDVIPERAPMVAEIDHGLQQFATRSRHNQN